MDVMTRIQELMASREGHWAALATIDAQLRAVENALGVPDSSPLAQPSEGRQKYRWTGAGSLTERNVLNALAAESPMTAAQIKERAGCTAPMILTSMTERGLITREMAKGTRGRLRVYRAVAKPAASQPLPVEQEYAAAV